MRYGLHSSLLGFEEVTSLFGLWLYFTGFAYVSLHDQHIRGGLLVGYMAPWAVVAMRRLFSVLAALICLYFFVLSLKYLGLPRLGRPPQHLPTLAVGDLDRQPEYRPPPRRPEPRDPRHPAARRSQP